MRLSFFLYLIASAITSTAAQFCCPNGLFTGDISKACLDENHTYGHLQCYDNYQISCNGISIGPQINFWYMPYNNGTIGECIDYCKEWAPGTVSANLQFGTELIPVMPTDYFCGCVSEVTQFVPRQSNQTQLPRLDYFFATPCPSGPASPSTCCQPFKGNISNVCLNPGSPDYGDGQCLPNGYKINCNQLWGKSAHSVGPFQESNLNLGSCYEVCELLAPGFTAANYAIQMNSHVIPNHQTNCNCLFDPNSLQSFNSTPGLQGPFNPGMITRTTQTLCGLSSPSSSSSSISSSISSRPSSSSSSRTSSSYSLSNSPSTSHTSSNSVTPSLSTSSKPAGTVTGYIPTISSSTSKTTKTSCTSCSSWTTKTKPGWPRPSLIIPPGGGWW